MDEREKLIGFATYYHNRQRQVGISCQPPEWFVDDWLESINCASEETQADRQNEDAEDVCDIDNCINMKPVEGLDNLFCVKCGSHT